MFLLNVVDDDKKVAGLLLGSLDGKLFSDLQWRSAFSSCEEAEVLICHKKSSRVAE